MANVVVTGANRGLGLEFVKQLVTNFESINVFALCRDPSKAENLNALAEKHRNITIIKADLTLFDTYNEIVNELQSKFLGGGLNLLINNAGILIRDTMETVTVENIVQTHCINTVAPLMFTKALIPLLKKADNQKSLGKSGGALVLNIGALLGSIAETEATDYLSYRLSKVALNMATKTLAIELKPMNICVLAVHPGWVKTDMGGPDAPITPDVSVAGVLKTAFAAGKELSGHFLGYEGENIPW